MKRIALPDGYPEIAQEWNIARNGYRADQASIGSKQWAWWRCLRKPKHEWQQPIYKRIRGLGCPICTIEDKSLAKLFPQIAQEWHVTLNGEVTPDDVAARGSHRAWWQCSNYQDHVWEAFVNNRTGKRKTGCPFCAGKKVDSSNSLAACRPDLAIEWHPTKNTLRPDEVSCGSRKKGWWQCRRNKKHVWQTDVTDRARAGAGCPFCAHKYVSDDNRLSIQAPEIAAEWHPTKNRIVYTDSSRGTFYKRLNNFIAPHEKIKLNRKRLSASDMPVCSREVAWWKCKAAAHEWQARISSRTRDGQGCPYCSGRRVIPLETSLAAKYPALVKRWHPSKNKPLKPGDVACMTDREVWWLCHRSADHVWKVEVSKVVRAYLNGHTGCPFCAGRRISKDNNVAAKFPARVKRFWHPTRNLGLKATELTPGGMTIVWWQCPKSNEHEWKTRICSITRAWRNGNSGCPFCSGRRVSGGETLAARHPELVKFWQRSRNLPSKPTKVGARGHKLFWWRCANLHVWQEEIGYIVKRFVNGKSVCRECQ
jgi:Probable Zinc-ribbon domain